MSTNRPQHVDQNWQPEDHQPADPVRDAAPELLAALKAMVSDRVNGPDSAPIFFQARAAIAKAEGK